MHRPRPVRRAFTLVELLVVISIIGILVAIMLPNLSKAIQSSHATVCLSNLRQMGMAIRDYESTFSQFPYYSEGSKVMGALVLGGQLPDTKIFKDKGMNANPDYQSSVPSIKKSNYRMYMNGVDYSEDNNPTTCPLCADGAKIFHKPGKPVCCVLYQDTHVDKPQVISMGTSDLNMLAPASDQGF